jgi:hypothetical protein
MIWQLINFVFLKMWYYLKINISFKSFISHDSLQFCFLILIMYQVLLSILSKKLCIRDVVHRSHCLTQPWHQISSWLNFIVHLKFHVLQIGGMGSTLQATLNTTIVPKSYSQVSSQACWKSSMQGASSSSGQALGILFLILMASNFLVLNRFIS